MSTADTIKPGDNLEPLTDDQLRAVIREYGLNSPWYGDEDGRTLESELLRRRPHLAGFRSALLVATQADLDEAAAKDPSTRMSLTAPLSPATEAIGQAYDKSVANWLAGS
jgi:hypothetical protein